jgi:DNA-binding GntR family transcriptional regulator
LTDIKQITNQLEEAIQEELEVDDDHFLERLEELRRYLKNLLDPAVLQSLLELYKLLDRGPEQFHYFSHHSQVGRECKFAVASLEAFKKKRLDKVKALLQECCDALEEIE